MKPNFKHILNERAYTACFPLAEELSFATETAYIFDLSYLSALEFVGKDVSTYLQGQVTCDVMEVNATQMRPGALCQLQGRILALMDIVAYQGWQMILPEDLSATTQSSLKKTALFSRVTCKPNPKLAFLGLHTASAAALPFEIHLPQTQWGVTQMADMACYAVGKDLYVLIVPADHKTPLFESFPSTQQRGSLAWHALELKNHRISIYPNTRELFLPHRLGLQHTAYLSFTKGCYKGQEIIARTQYRAKLKHELKFLQIKTTEPIFAGQKIYDVNQREVGEIIDYCPIGDCFYYVLASILLDCPNEVFYEGHTTALSI